MAVRTLVVWCPDWPVVASGHPPEVPVAVLTAGQVLACSAGARDEGVEPGLRRRQAEARCPGLLVLDHDPGGEARAFEPVVAAVEQFTPLVEVVRPGVCALPTRGPSRYFGGDEALAAKVADAVDRVLAVDGGSAGERPVRCRVGIADGPFVAERAAWLGVTVPPGGSAAFLAPFPVATFGRPELADLLRRLGIHTVGDLAALPPGAVLGRFGADGAAAHRLARGLDERPVAARTPSPDLAVATELDPPAERLDTAAFAAKALADRLHQRLARRGLEAGRVLVEAESEHGEQLARRWRHDGALGPAALAERVRWQLDGWLSSPRRPTGGLTLLRLTPEELGPARGRQLGFWGGHQAGDDRAARALARVQGMLGPAAVAIAELGGGRGPADRVRLVPWDDLVADTPLATSPTSGAPTTPVSVARHPPEATAPWPGRIPPPAPATVLDRPAPARVVDGTGEPVAVDERGQPSAEPTRLAVTGGAEVAVVAWAGPWPLDERWWDPRAHRRLARWQLLTADGSAHLLALDDDGRWWLEATYD